MVGFEVARPVLPGLQARAEAVQEYHGRGRPGARVSHMQAYALGIEESRRRPGVLSLQRRALLVGGISHASAPARDRQKDEPVPQHPAHQPAHARTAGIARPNAGSTIMIEVDPQDPRQRRALELRFTTSASDVARNQ